MENKPKIPKVIHFVWYGDKRPYYIDLYIRMVKDMYPKYKIKIWGMKDFDPRENLYSRKAYEEKKWAFVSDYLRAKILYEEGGIYLDTDMIPIKSMEPYLVNKVVVGFEYNKLLGTGFAAAEKGHPYFKKILEIYDAFEMDPDKEFKFIVNNELWTYVLKETYDLKLSGKEQLLTGDVKVYPQTYFSDMNLNDDTIYLHDHKLSWTSPLKAKVMKPMLKNIQRNQSKVDWLLHGVAKLQFRKHRQAIKRVQKLRHELEEQNKK